MGWSFIPTEHSMVNKTCTVKSMVLVAFIAMGVLSGLELLIYVLVAFDSARRGTYFRFFMIAILSQLIMTLGDSMILWSALKPGVFLGQVGYLVTALLQFLLLRSRLKLFGSQTEKFCKVILYVALAEVVLVELPLTILHILAVFQNDAHLYNIYSWCSCAESIVYAIVDIGILSTYLLSARNHWKTNSTDIWKATFRQLVLMSSMIALVDAAYIILSFKFDNAIVTGVEGLLFGMVLKLEMLALGRLARTVRGGEALNVGGGNSFALGPLLTANPAPATTT